MQNCLHKKECFILKTTKTFNCERQIIYPNKSVAKMKLFLVTFFVLSFLIFLVTFETVDGQRQPRNYNNAQPFSIGTGSGSTGSGSTGGRSTGGRNTGGNSRSRGGLFGRRGNSGGRGRGRG